MTQSTLLTCACGQVHLEARKSPIISSECHCTSCRTAGARLQTLPGAPPVLESNGGTQYVLYRKDRVQFAKGAGLLKEFRLASDAPTRRVVASCCNTPMFLEFKGGHWLSLYGHRWPDGTLPPMALRTMTSDLPDATVLPDDLPNGKRQSLTFFAKLLGAWIAMGFRAPKIDITGGELHA